MNVGKIGSTTATILLLLVTILVSACGRPASAAALDPSSASSMAEPGFAAEFVADYARGDEAAAERVASPLYRLEWSRRGLTSDDRQALRYSTGPAASSDVSLRFSYAGGGLDRLGFGHLLYLVRPIGSGQTVAPSAWRVDTDPNGRVIWAEMVFLFSPNPNAVAPIVEKDAAADVPMPEALAKLHPRLVSEVRSGVGKEGYYAVAVRRAAAKSGTTTSTESIVFFGVDAEGELRPGAWSYGNADPEALALGQKSPARTAPADPEVARLEQSYLEALA
jgi:hypothetical protein